MMDDFAMEPEPEPPLALLMEDAEPEPEPELALPAVAPQHPDVPGLPERSTGLVEILPPDFPLPLLTKFVPNAQLRVQADEAAVYALGIEVQGPQGLKAADLALTVLRTRLQAIEEHFSEPVQIANRLHKRLTALRSEWTDRGGAALRTVGQRMFVEEQRLERAAVEVKRQAQEQADREAREAARQEAERAQAQQAPAEVVQELFREAETAQAPPVAVPEAEPPKLTGSTSVKSWACRIAGSDPAFDANPAVSALTPGQRQEVFKLLRAILDGQAPLMALELNWSFLNARAKADKGTFAIPGLESFQVGGMRGKARRSA